MFVYERASRLHSAGAGKAPLSTRRTEAHRDPAIVQVSWARLWLKGAIPGSHFAVTACPHGSRGRERPGNLPHSAVLSAGGVVLVEDSGLVPPPSDKDARWHDRAPAERQRDRRRPGANRSPAAPQQP